MTEYDFSPEAQQKFQDKMQSVGRWVDNTEAHKNQFGSAFQDVYREALADTRRRPSRRDPTSRRRGASMDARHPVSPIYAPLPGPMPTSFLSPPPPQLASHRSHPGSSHATPAGVGVYAPATPAYATNVNPATGPILSRRPQSPPVQIYFSAPPQPNTSAYIHAPKPQYAPAAAPTPQWAQGPPSQPPPPPAFSPPQYHNRSTSAAHHPHSHHQHHYQPPHLGPSSYMVVPPPGALNIRVVQV
ncbi:hypothetical protein CYLTODRAFT_426308 [Cylindrobasidium torrendii FP15055 ss-10]|uniref:Uncharacterized protein n=1 Tax=Cylindrobasidium torrendii FP15055 ss-10 TaxID=1314674 RepID=A0A0D7B133_9AGAR|nr:hypothetical protein CYLTODRAFT_426308 [Cylindrobasidium torrendii FP15055 ss-10]